MTKESRERLQEINCYSDVAFPVSMHIVNKYDIFPEGRGFQDIHWHEELQFTMALKGTLKMQVDNVEYGIEEGEAIFVNRELLHLTTDISEDGQYVGFMFPQKLLGFFAGSRMEQEDVLPYINNYILPTVQIRRVTGWQTEILTELSFLKDLFERRGRGFEYQVSLKLANIWYLLVENNRDNLKQVSKSYLRRQERMKAMMTYIHDNYMNEVKQSDVAAAASISEEEGRRCFRATISQSPRDYLVSYRISRSMELLIEKPELSVTEVAITSGFNDVSHYIQCFKKKNGMTPKDYRDKQY